MIKAVIFDLDGTLYLGKTPITGAVEAIKRLREEKFQTLFLTNAATRSRAGVALKLANMGFEASESEIYDGAYLLAKYVSQNHKGKKVYVVGEKGIFEEFKKAGVPATELPEDAEVVVVGLDRQLTYEKLCRAHIALSRGAVFLASNMDHTYPLESGSLPGAGSIVTAIEYASGKKPHIVGKPNPYVLELIMKEHRLKKDEMLMVGDRLDSDITFAKNCGIKSALVLTGSSKKNEIRSIVPDHVFGSVAEMVQAMKTWR